MFYNPLGNHSISKGRWKMLLKKKIINITALLLVVTAVALVGNWGENALYVSVKTVQKPQIILDAGHAGFS